MPICCRCTSKNAVLCRGTRPLSALLRRFQWFAGLLSEKTARSSASSSSKGQGAGNLPVASACLTPTHLGVCQPGNVRFQVEDDPLGGTWQRDTSHQQNDKHHVREGGSEVNNLWVQGNKRREGQRGGGTGIISSHLISSAGPHPSKHPWTLLLAIAATGSVEEGWGRN